jgi:hypothetical protein
MTALTDEELKRREWASRAVGDHDIAAIYAELLELRKIVAFVHSSAPEMIEIALEQS